MAVSKNRSGNGGEQREEAEVTMPTVDAIGAPEPAETTQVSIPVPALVEVGSVPEIIESTPDLSTWRGEGKTVDRVDFASGNTEKWMIDKVVNGKVFMHAGDHFSVMTAESFLAERETEDSLIKLAKSYDALVNMAADKNEILKAKFAAEKSELLEYIAYSLEAAVEAGKAEKGKIDYKVYVQCINNWTDDCEAESLKTENEAVKIMAEMALLFQIGGKGELTPTLEAEIVRAFKNEPQVLNQVIHHELRPTEPFDKTIAEQEASLTAARDSTLQLLKSEEVKTWTLETIKGYKKDFLERLNKLSIARGEAAIDTVTYQNLPEEWYKFFSKLNLATAEKMAENHQNNPTPRIRKFNPRSTVNTPRTQNTGVVPPPVSQLEKTESMPRSTPVPVMVEYEETNPNIAPNAPTVEKPANDELEKTETLSAEESDALLKKSEEKLDILQRRARKIRARRTATEAKTKAKIVSDEILDRERKIDSGEVVIADAITPSDKPPKPSLSPIEFAMNHPDIAPGQEANVGANKEPIPVMVEEYDKPVKQTKSRTAPSPTAETPRAPGFTSLEEQTVKTKEYRSLGEQMEAMREAEKAPRKTAPKKIVSKTMTVPKPDTGNRKPDSNVYHGGGDPTKEQMDNNFLTKMFKKIRNALGLAEDKAF